MEKSKDVMDALNELIHEKNIAEANHLHDDSIVDLDDLSQNETGEDSVGQSTQREFHPPNKSHKKWRRMIA